MSDLVAEELGRSNRITRAQGVENADLKRSSMRTYLADRLAEGTLVQVVIPEGAADSATDVRAVVLAGNENINCQLIEQGYGADQRIRPGPFPAAHT